MPFQSESQRRFLFSQHPKIAEEFAEHTPKNANLPEHAKHNMAEGGVPEDKDAPAKPDEKKPEGDAFTEGIKNGINHDSDAVKSYLASKFKGLLHTNNELDKMEAAGYADGGVWMQNEPASTVEEVTHVEGKKPTEDAPTEISAAHSGTVDKSDDEKRSEIYRAMGMDKYAIGGTPSPLPPELAQGLNMPNSQDPTFWDQIKAALGKVAAPITKPLGAMADMTTKAAQAATPLVQAAAPGAVSAINSLTGANLPVPAAPASQVPESASPTPLSANVPTPPAAPKPPMSAPMAAPHAPAAPASDVQGIFNQDTSKLTEGSTAEDRQKIVDTMGAKQTGLGSIIAQAVAGLGDAIAAKGGREQHSLKDIFAMQKQQRDEALMNFDKARQDRLEKLDLQTKMGNNTLSQLAAKDAYGVDEHLNKMLGAPTGTAHKDLPLYMQMMTAKAAQSEKDSDLYMKAHKQAADEVEASIKNAGMFNFKPGPEQIKAAGAKLADTYYNRAKGNILFQPSDGQKPVWIPAQNMQKAKQMDPNGSIIP